MEEPEVKKPTVADRIRGIRPAQFDLLLALVGLCTVAAGAAFVYAPSGLITFGLGLFYLGVWHR